MAKKVDQAKFVQGLDFGEADSILLNKSDNKLTQLLLDLTNELIADLSKELDKHRATGNLASSILPSKINPESIEVTAPYYWKYLNYGVNGIKVQHGAPTHEKSKTKTELTFYEAILKWIKDKGIKPKDADMELEELAGRIKNAVRMNGIKPTHFFDNVVNEERIAEISKPISALIKESIITIIKKPST